MKTADQDECVLCCGEINIYAIGCCDHSVCYECSSRMRVLCETFECPICRSNMPLVIYTYQKQPFLYISEKYSLSDKKYQIVFENSEVQKCFQRLLENKCRECGEVFQTFNKLKDHVRRKHNLHYCELCCENLKIFPFERKVYNRKDLARHKILGDPDETSHRGHPLCEFCDQRYVDSDELFRHLRREHYYCHFCDADGKHQYYEDYEYLRVHFRKEHYLCEEGDCANEQFTGVFRTEIDLKAHKALHHCKNKSKAEARQARMLDLEFTFSNRSGGTSSPRSSRYNHHRRQNVEENSKEIKSNQQAAAEKVNTHCTSEFPYLSEDSENKASHMNSVPKSSVNNVSIQSFGRNLVPHRQKPVMTSDDFPALVSTSINVTAEGPANQNRKLNFSISRYNNPVKTNVSIHMSQKNNQQYSSTSIENKETNNNVQKTTWITKKKSNFENEFPRLETKSTPATTFTSVHTCPVNTTAESTMPFSSVTVSNSHGGDQFVIIKNKSKKKKHRSAWTDDKIVDNQDEYNGKDEAVKNNFNLLGNNNFKLNSEEKDKFKRNMVRSSNNHVKLNYADQEMWHEKASFRVDDFPPLALSEAVRKPPGFNGPKKKKPPPGFNINSNECTVKTPINVSLGLVAQQIVTQNQNKTNTESQLSLNKQYEKPQNFHLRNKKLIEKIQEISNAQDTDVFDEFKTLSGKFRQNIITAAEYHSKCLEILNEQEFCDIFPELIALLPDIDKQQELLEVHTKYQSHQKNSGAIPKQKLLYNMNIRVCDICHQVLMVFDHENHVLSHET